MASLFSRIIARELPAQIVAEDEQYIAFLDIMPLVKGHVLVVPKREVSYIFDLEPEELSGLHLFAQKVAKAMDKTLTCTRIGMAVIGLEVPHVHIHLVPLRTRWRKQEHFIRNYVIFETPDMPRFKKHDYPVFYCAPIWWSLLL